MGSDQVTASAQDDAVGYFPGEAARTQVRACPAGQDAQAVSASVRTSGLTLVLAPGL
ncbi:hypothetical protein [Microbacterium lacticum]